MCTANSRRGLEAWLAGMKAADSIVMMFGVHGAEKVGGGFLVGFVLAAAPMNAEAVAEATEQADDAHRFGFAHSAEIIEVGDVESLVQAAFDAPGRTIVLKPLGGAKFFGQKTGHQRDDFRLVMAQVAAQQGHLLDTGKIDGFGRGGLGA
jgi:hypothetical protein